MTDYVQPASAGFLCITQFVASLACYSLRDFSRSRLDEICTSRGRQQRFGDILKGYELALIAAELLAIGNAVLLGVVLYQWWGLAPSPQFSPTDWALWGLIWIGILTAYALVAVVVPWSVARISGESFLYRFWPLLAFVRIVFQPVIGAAQRLDTVLHRVSGVVAPENGDAATITEEIRTVVDEGHSEGLLRPGARTMINRVMELQDEDAASVMTPRTDMVTISADASVEEAGNLMLQEGHSRVPVVGESIDDIVGVLYAKDLLNPASNGSDVTLRDLVREPFYVPETTSVDRLLETMQRKQMHMAIVLDEYGGVAGLVTMEDILEEIVGEIEDEYDVAEEEPIQQIEPGIDEVDARVHIDDLNELRQYDLPEETDYETIGGFVSSYLGRIPESGETFTWNQLRFTVVEADKRRVVKLRIEVDESLAATAADEQ